MPTVALSGDDTVTINNRIFADLADGDAVLIDFPNDVGNVKTGKNGNSIYGLNTSGRQSEVKIRVIRGSADDKFLNNLFAQQQANFSAFVLMLGEFIKKIGDGTGTVTNDTYIMSGGIFTKSVPAKTNTDGDSEQSVAVYTLKFSNSPRVIT